MRASSVVRAISRDLLCELIGALQNESRAAWRRAELSRAAKKAAGYVAAVIAAALAINVLLSAPTHESGTPYQAHDAVNGLHIAVPSNLHNFPIEQLVPLP